MLAIAYLVGCMFYRRELNQIFPIHFTTTETLGNAYVNKELKKKNNKNPAISFYLIMKRLKYCVVKSRSCGSCKMQILELKHWLGNEVMSCLMGLINYVSKRLRQNNYFSFIRAQLPPFIHTSLPSINPLLWQRADA